METKPQTASPSPTASPGDKDTLRRLFLFASFGILLAAGLIVVVGTVSSTTLKRMIDNSASTDEMYRSMGRGELALYIIGSVMIILSVAFGALALRTLPMSDPDATDADPIRYNRYLVGIGYALVLLAILNFVAMAGFAYVDQLQNILDVNFSSNSTSAAATTRAVVTPGHIHFVLFMLMMPGYAVLGALFFTANSLRQKRETLTPSQSATTSTLVASAISECPSASHSTGSSPSDSTPPPTSAARVPEGTVAKVDVAVRTGEPFDEARFWGGLWFRLGEAVLFTLVIFLVIGSSFHTTSGEYLLLMSLLLGMFVKTGEGLIAGLADKLFAAVKAIVK